MSFIANGTKCGVTDIMYTGNMGKMSHDTY